MTGKAAAWIEMTTRMAVAMALAERRPRPATYPTHWHPNYRPETQHQKDAP